MRTLNPIFMHAPKASKNTLTSPSKGVLIKEPATCSDCGRNCTIGGTEKARPGYYTNDKEKLCKLCAYKEKII